MKSPQSTRTPNSPQFAPPGAKRRVSVFVAIALTFGCAVLPRAEAEVTVQNGRLYRLLNMNSMLTPDGSTAAGVQLEQQTPTGATTGLSHQQLWQAISVSGSWKFLNLKSGLYLEVAGSSATAGAPVDQAAGTSGHNQLWSLHVQTDGSYMIQNYHSGLELQVSGGSTAPGGLLIQQTNNGTAPQHWVFEEAAAGAGQARVYMGGGAEYSGYLTTTNNWTWDQANIDGLYITNGMSSDPTNATQNANLQEWANLLTNKNVFYETDAKLSTDSGDVARINILRTYLSVTYTICNEGLPADRITALRTAQWRPVLAMVAPWEIGGNFNNSSNSTMQATVLSCDGSGTDGPMGFWHNNQGGFQGGCATLDQFAHSHGKLAEQMLATHTCGTKGTSQSIIAQNGVNYVAYSQACVRTLEDNGTAPDVWALSYYDPADDTYPYTPESNSDGSNANTITGCAYWLIHHIQDPSVWTRIEVTPQDDLQVQPGRPKPIIPAEKAMANAPLTTDESTATLYAEGSNPEQSITRTVTYRVRNESSWLDTCPVISAELADSAQRDRIHIRVNGQDVTREMIDGGGLVFNKDLRMWPGGEREITVSVELTDAQAVAMQLVLIPNPSETSRVHQRMHLCVTREPATGKALAALCQ